MNPFKNKLNVGGVIMAIGKKKAEQKPSLEAFQVEISKLAEEVYRKRIAGKKQGDALSDWLQAEKEVKKKYKI